jgi:hypothetical protein
MVCGAALLLSATGLISVPLQVGYIGVSVEAGTVP